MAANMGKKAVNWAVLIALIGGIILIFFEPGEVDELFEETWRLIRIYARRLLN